MPLQKTPYLQRNTVQTSLFTPDQMFIYKRGHIFTAQNTVLYMEYGFKVHDKGQ